MSKVIRVKPHLTLEEIDARLKHLHDFWRIRRWLVIRHALVDPAPAKDIACRLGLSVCTVRDLMEAYNPTTPLYLALCLSSLAMAKIGPVITLLHPCDQR